MVIRNYHWLNSASRVLISTCSAPLVQTGERKQFSLFDLDFRPMTLTYNPRLAKVKVDPHAKNQGQTVQTGERPRTNGRTNIHAHRRYHTYYLPCYAVDNDQVQEKPCLCCSVKSMPTLVKWSRGRKKLCGNRRQSSSPLVCRLLSDIVGCVFCYFCHRICRDVVTVIIVIEKN